MSTPYNSRFPQVDLLDEQGQPTGLSGQVFGRVIGPDGEDTLKVAVMLTSGGQGCKHWPAEKLKVKS